MIGSSIAASVEDGLDKMARHARMVLVVIAVLNLGGALLLWIAGGVTDVAGLAPRLVTGVAFVVLAVWARRSPMLPVTIGVAIYGVSLVASIAVDPAQVLSMWGLLLNAALIVLCINGISAARSYEDLRRRLGSGKA
jgi:peptidoglycan/LPS O-acetylase OafA/YrhL